LWRCLKKEWWRKRKYMINKLKKIKYNVLNFVFEQLFFIIFWITVIALCLILSDRINLPEDKETESIIGIVIIYTGVIFNLVSYKIANDQFFKSLFTEFNKRFDKMNESLNAIRENNFEPEKKTTKEKVILDYLNLCAEEYLWYTKGRIDTKVWKSWKNGMEFYLLNENFYEIVEKQKAERNSYYGLFDLFKEELKIKKEVSKIGL
jgi:hypothetical protein